MLEITGDDIASLSDEDLRTLVARLCEAELRRRSLPTSAVTWGGNQTAPDGGLDVRVALPASTAVEGWVPRAATGFLVKAEDMPRHEILKEMRPSGNVRPVIKTLTGVGGAYIIVSSKGSTSDLALGDRRKAMVEALDGMADREALALDFYDRTRVATWLRDHPGLRERIGRTLQGWRSYGAGLTRRKARRLSIWSMTSYESRQGENRTARVSMHRMASVMSARLLGSPAKLSGSLAFRA
jgi:hypothetical protein